MKINLNVMEKLLAVIIINFCTTKRCTKHDKIMRRTPVPCVYTTLKFVSSTNLPWRYWQRYSYLFQYLPDFYYKIKQILIVERK
jgi:hypothetical protein